MGKLRELRTDQIKVLMDEKKSYRAKLKKTPKDSPIRDEIIDSIESVDQAIEAERASIITPIIESLIHGRVDIKLSIRI